MSENITQTIERLTQLVQEKAPNVDTSPGSVFSELIIGLESQIQNQVYNDIQSIGSGQSIAQALSSLEDTYNPVIDQIASNYGVSRGQGSYSTGRVKIYVSTIKNYNVPAGLSFVQPTLGYTYNTVTSYAINSGDLVSENGIYYFTVEVQANNVGSRKNIANGTAFNLLNANQLLGFVKASASGSFSDGLDTETDRELINRFRTGLSSKNLLTHSSIINQLRGNFPGLRDVYLAGSDSGVNNRNIVNSLGIKSSGAVDVYIRNGVTIPYHKFNTSDAVYVGSGKWNISLPKEVSPGFYRVSTVRNSADDQLTYLKFKTTYSYDNGSNRLNNSSDARYSVYQNAVIEVDYRAPEVSEVVTFEVTTLEPMDLSGMQDAFLDEANRVPCADYLAKGIVPCLVSLNISVTKRDPSSTVDVSSIQGDIFNYINGLSAGEPINVSRIVDICHNYNIKRVDLPLSITGRILAPYSSTGEVIDYDIVIAGNDFLEIPELPQHGVTSNNTMFFVEYFTGTGEQNINVSVK